MDNYRFAFFNLKRIFTLINNEVEAMKFLQSFGIIQNERFCVNGHSMKLSCVAPMKWRCSKLQCRNEKGLRTGNWLEGSRMKLDTIVHFIYCWSQELTSVNFSNKELDMSKEAVIDYNNYLREVCIWKIESLSGKIGGEGFFVEIDETTNTKRNNNGRATQRQWAFGGICRETNECFLVSVPDRNAHTLLCVIKEKVKPGTNVVSDCWKSYCSISQESDDHFTVDRPYNFVVPDSLQNAQTTERLWGSAKWGNKKRRGPGGYYPTSYLAEFMWRQRLCDKDPFMEILNDIKSYYDCSNVNK